MPRPQRDCDERYAEQFRRTLGEQRFAAAYQHGGQLPQQEAIRYALGEGSRRAAAGARLRSADPTGAAGRHPGCPGLSAKQIAAI